MIWVLVVVAWLACAISAAGFSLADSQRRFPKCARSDYRATLGIWLLMGLMGGPIFLFVSIFLSGFCEHGWTLRPPADKIEEAAKGTKV